MTIKRFPLFMEGDDDNASGGSRVADILPPVGGAEPHEPNNEPGGDDEPPTPTPVPQQVTLDPTAFADAIRAAGLGAKANEPEKPLTPEQIAEYKKQLGYFEFKPEFFTKFNNMETQAAAFQEYHDGITQQFMNMMQAFVQQRDAGLLERVNPALQFVQKHHDEQIETRFHTTYPDLGKPELRPLFEAVVANLKASGTRFKDEAALFKAVGDGMATTIRGFNPDFKLTPAGSSPAKPNPNAIKPAPRGGAGGGGSHTTDSSSGVPKAVSLLPKIRA